MKHNDLLFFQKNTDCYIGRYPALRLWLQAKVAKGDNRVLFKMTPAC
jgi:hypothetical protein